MRSLIWLVLVAFLSVPYQAMANTCVRQLVAAEQPYGTASLYKFFFHIYDAEFWTDGSSWSMDAPFALKLTYFVDIDAQDVLDRTIQELRRNPQVTEEMLGKYRQLLGGLYPDIKDGDYITALYHPVDGTYLCHNGKSLGAIAPAQLVQPFFEIWLGVYSSEPDLRDALLGVGQ